jgi:hypothetical protein
MAPTTVIGSTQDEADYRKATTFLRLGQVDAGVALLGGIGKRTEDDRMRSQCLHNLGQVWARTGKTAEAYRVWYDLAHKLPRERNEWDLAARDEMIRLFSELSLRLPPPEFPPCVQVEVTNRCDRACGWCSRGQMRRRETDLTPELLRRVADQCAVEPFARIELYHLGEPLCHPRIEEMIAYLDSVRDRSPVPLRYGLRTNGVLLTRGRAAALIAAGLREFTISLDGPAGARDRPRRAADRARVERNVQDLLELRTALERDDVFVAVAMRDEGLDAEAVQRFRSEWEPRADAVYIGDAPNGPAGTRATAAAKPPRRGSDQANNAGRRRYCGQGARLLVHADGRYAFCCGDVDGVMDLGRVAERSIRDVWNSIEITRIRREVARAVYGGLAPCRTCPLSRFP